MGRANAIVIGSVVLAPLILGVEGYALFRTHHRPPPPAEVADLPAAAPLSAALPAEVPRVAPPPAARAVPAPAPPPPDEPAAAKEPAAAPSDPMTFGRRRELLAQQRQIVRDADEEVFDALKLPGAQRSSIRAIDDQYVRALQSMEPASTAADVAGASADLNANETRRAAITDVLGADEMHAFTFEERKFERRVRAELRAQSLGGP